MRLSHYYLLVVRFQREVVKVLQLEIYVNSCW